MTIRDLPDNHDYAYQFDAKRPGLPYKRVMAHDAGGNRGFLDLFAGSDQHSPQQWGILRVIRMVPADRGRERDIAEFNDRQD